MPNRDLAHEWTEDMERLDVVEQTPDEGIRQEGEAEEDEGQRME